MDVHPPKNGINRYWFIAIWLPMVHPQRRLRLWWNSWAFWQVTSRSGNSWSIGSPGTMMICWSKPQIFQQQYLVYLWLTWILLDAGIANLRCFLGKPDILHAKLGHLKFKNPRIEYLCDAFEILWNRAWKLGNLWVQTTSFPRYGRRTQAFVGKTCGFSARLNNYKTR